MSQSDGFILWRSSPRWHDHLSIHERKQLHADVLTAFHPPNQLPTMHWPEQQQLLVQLKKKKTCFFCWFGLIRPLNHHPSNHGCQAEWLGALMSSDLRRPPTLGSWCGENSARTRITTAVLWSAIQCDAFKTKTSLGNMKIILFLCLYIHTSFLFGGGGVKNISSSSPLMGSYLLFLSALLCWLVWNHSWKRQHLTFTPLLVIRATCLSLIPTPYGLLRY